MLETLRETGRGRAIVTVGNNITEHSRAGLIDHDLSMVLAHPIARLAPVAVSTMLANLRAGSAGSNAILGFDIFTPEIV